MLIALGPVQDFIATARKTRDLWFGSFLLSECSKAVAAYLHGESDGQARATLIFPNPQHPSTDLAFGQPNGLNVCNIILCNAHVSSEEEARRLATQAVAAGKARLREMKNNALNVQGINRPVADAQIEDLLEAYWSVTPLEHPRDYVPARKRLYHALDARKATRDFDPPSWSAAGLPKSSLDGAREIVTPDDDSQLKRLGLKRGERLCAVGVLKRLGMRGLQGVNQQRFASTSSVAAAPLLTDANSGRVLEYFQAINQLAGGDEQTLRELTGAALFESRLRETLDDGQITEPALSDRENQAKAMLKSLLRDLSGGVGITPSPYYALILGDGDNMGAVIDSLETIEAQQGFSSKLAGFASAARATVESHQGCLIYAGGDDVLALLPLHTALAAAQQLSGDFDAAVGEYSTADGLRPSLSAGLVVWHHLEPLDEALQAARAAEKTAKAIAGKNALCVTLSKRSGSQASVSDKFLALTERMEAFVAAHNDPNDGFSHGAAYQLRSMLADLEGMPDAQLSEVARILRRKEGNPVAIEQVIEQFHAVRSAVQAANPAPATETQQAEQQHEAFEQLVDEIIIARVFADARRQRQLIASAPPIGGTA